MTRCGRFHPRPHLVIHQDNVMEERAKLIQMNDQVRSRVEAMITRLKAMENSP